VPKQVNGFLATDGTFFEREPECKRYETLKQLESLCVTHEVNHENFMAMINSWHTIIRGYLNADEDCETKYTRLNDLTPRFDDEASAFLRTEDDREDPPRGDKDAPGFLEQQVRRNK
jgi:hypothetical protein